ncbi:hypothetical protein O8F87_002231, partial [Neisseria gonorrhoeae]
VPRRRALPVDGRCRHGETGRGRGVMMNPTEFLKARIAEWEAKSKEAGGNADFKAFEFAESEIKNYKAMSEAYEQPAA